MRIALWNEILAGGRLARVSVSGDGKNIPLKPSIAGIRPPLISVWGPEAGRVRALADKARALPDKHGLLLFGGGDTARWVPPGNLAALEADFARVRLEIEHLRAQCEQRWEEIRAYCVDQVREYAQSLGVSWTTEEEWVRCIREKFPERPTLGASLLTLVVTDPVTTALEEERLRLAAAEQQAARARAEALAAITRQIVDIGAEIQQAIQNRFREVFNNFLAGLDSALAKGRRGEAPKARALADGLRGLVDLIDALGRDFVASIGDESSAAILALQEHSAELIRVMESATRLTDVLPIVAETIERMQNAGLLARSMRCTVFCPRCGSFEATLHQEQNRCPRCQSWEAVILPHPE